MHNSSIYEILKNISVILVDDCSKDNNWECYRNEKNSGVSYMRNHGFEEADSEYILFVDSDDWMSGKIMIGNDVVISKHVRT